MSAQLVWIASYPRSGNTWMRMLLESLNDGGRAPDINATRLPAPTLSAAEFEVHLALSPSLLTLAEVDAVRGDLYRAIAAAGEGPLAFRKLHDAFCAQHYPADASHGAIVIVRDPRDVAVSMAPFLGLTIDAAIDAMADPDWHLTAWKGRSQAHLPQHVGSWSANVARWIDCDAMPTVLVRYEDILTDAAHELRRVADFLGWDGVVADAAAAACGFAVLSGQEAVSGFVERPKSANRFFRVGRSGGWCDVLTEAQTARIVRDHGDMMRRLGYRID